VCLGLNGAALNLRILIADDYESVIRSVRAILEAHSGWEVCGEATNGREAVLKASELKPDLIILDLAMPEIDGLRAAGQILAMCPTVPIVLHTLYVSAQLELEAQKYGIRKVVSKSETGALVKAVAELFIFKKPHAKAPLSVIEIGVTTSKTSIPRSAPPGVGIPAQPAEINGATKDSQKLEEW
jgi:DNA-binding NarL/FixJ family response regulator